MAIDEKSLIYIGIAAAAGFALGRMSAAKVEAQVTMPPLGTGATPPPLPPPARLEPQGDAPPGTFADRWDTIDLEVEVYPGHADPTRISPPTQPAVAAAAADCSIIALPSGWWDRAGTIAQEHVEAGETDRRRLARRVIAKLLPACAGSSTEAMQAVKLELDRELMALLPAPQPGIAVTNPALSPSASRTRTIRR